MDILFICSVQGPVASNVLGLVELLSQKMPDTRIEVHTPRKQSVLKRLKHFLGDKKNMTPALIMYIGDSDRDGWKIIGGEKVLFQEIVDLMNQYPARRRISILNDTQYGQMLIKELIGVRDPLFTSVMTDSQFAENVWPGQATSLALECWSEGLIPEIKIDALAPGNSGAYQTLPIWQRWGERIEDLLFAEMKKVTRERPTYA